MQAHSPPRTFDLFQKVGGGIVKDPEAFAVFGLDVSGGESGIAEFENVFYTLVFFFTGDQKDDCAGGVENGIGEREALRNPLAFYFNSANQII